MEQFSYSFIITALHSIWQSALLLLVYSLFISANRKTSPLAKRNLLYAILGLQLLTSLVTFSLVVSKTSFTILQQYASSLTSSLQGTWLATNASVLFSVYAIVVLWRMASCFFSWNRFKRKYQQSLTKPDIDIRLFTQTKAFQFGISRKVATWCSNTISTPMTFGFWKPVILLPVALVNQLTIRETEALIIHELTHIRHFDYILNWLLVVTENLFFFNPFVRIMAQKIRTEREKNCDVQVLLFGYADIQYAETLLKTAKYQQQELTLQLGAIRKKDQLLHRIHFFSNNHNLDFRRSQPAVFSGGLLLAVVINIILALFFMAAPVLNKPSRLLAAAEPAILKVAEREMVKSISNVRTMPTFVTIEETETRPVVTVAKEVPVEEGNSTEEATLETAEPFYALPAANPETSLYEGKEIMIKEEGSDGKKITAVYQAILIDGIWTLQPLWMLSETKTVIVDSLKERVKDSVIKIYPIVQ